MKTFNKLVLAELSVAFILFGSILIVLSVITASELSIKAIGVVAGALLFLGGLYILKRISNGSIKEGVANLIDGIFTIW